MAVTGSTRSYNVTPPSSVDWTLGPVNFSLPFTFIFTASWQQHRPNTSLINNSVIF